MGKYITHENLPFHQTNWARNPTALEWWVVDGALTKIRIKTDSNAFCRLPNKKLR